MSDENGNGHNENFDLGLELLDDAVRKNIEGARADLESIFSEDGRLAQAARKSEESQGVINRYTTAVDNKNLRNIMLRTGNYKMQRMFAEALAECRKYQLDDQIEYLGDLMHIEAGNSISSMWINALKALTHTTITANTNAMGSRVRKWWERNNERSKSGFNEIER